jgi:hypothetical protein
MCLDLWELPPASLTASITEAVESNFYSRCDPHNRPHHLREKLLDPKEISVSSASTKEGEALGDPEKITPHLGDHKHRDSWFRRRKPEGPKYDASLVRALHETFFIRIWIAGALKLCSGWL